MRRTSLAALPITITVVTAAALASAIPFRSSSSAQPTEAPASPVTWRPAISAGGALLAERTLFVLEGDLLAVAAYDIVADRRLWRTEIQTAAVGAHELAAFGPNRLLASTGGALIVIDRASGRIVARHAKPRAIDGERAHLWRNGGACALRTQCALVAIDCEDARPVGEVMRGRMQSRMRFRHDGWDTGCWGFHPDVIGGGRGVTVLSREGSDGADVVMGIDTQTGRTAWQRSIATRGYGAGASRDGDLCWVIARPTDDADRGSLHAFACRTGRARFTVPDVDLAVWSGTEPSGLFVSGARRAALVEPRRGRPRWQHTHAPNEIALVAGARVDEEAAVYMGAEQPRTLAVLAPRDGSVVTRVPLPAHETVLGRADGTLHVGDTIEIDATGAQHPSSAAPAALEVSRGGGSSPATVYLTRPSRRAILRFPSDAWSLGRVSDATSTYDAVYVSSATGPGVVRVLIAPR